MARKRKTQTAAERLDAMGLDAICERIASGESQKSVANSLGVWASHFAEWVAADPERSARLREARRIAAQHWDSEAEAVLKGADETLPGSIAKARELASHYRWRASKQAPKDYGDKVEVEQTVTGKLTTVIELVAMRPAGDGGESAD